MDRSYSLRGRRNEEYDPMLGPTFPNVPGPPPPVINIPQPETDGIEDKMLNLAASIASSRKQPDESPQTRESELPDEVIYQSHYKEDEDKYWAMVRAMEAPNVPYDFYNPPSSAISTQSRQFGGQVKAGRPYRVGEEGEEIIIPQTDGTVIPSPEVAPDLTENTLRNIAMTNPNLSFRNFITPNTEPTSQNAILNAVSRATPPETKKPTNSLLDYWAKPVIGGIPRDMFVQLAGSLAHAIAPREWSGRIGANLAQMGGQAYAERIRREREEPENALRRRLLEAQAKKLEEPEKPTEWGAFYREHINTINPKTGKTFTVGETLKAFHEAQATPKEPQYDIDVQQDLTGKWQHGRRNQSTGIFTADRPATEAEITSKVTGKPITETLPDYREWAKIPGNKGKTYEDFKKWEVDLKAKEVTPKTYEPHRFIKPDGTIGWVEPGKEVPKGWKPYEKPEKAEKLSIGDAKTIYNARINGIKTRMMLDMTPDEQAVVANQPPENIMALLLSGRIGKSLNPTKKEQYRQETLDAETEFNDLSGGVMERKGVKIPSKAVTPEAEIEGGTISSRGKIIPGPFKKVAPLAPKVPLPEKRKPETEKGKTFSVRDIVDAGGKVRKDPDGIEHVWDKDGKYMGSIKE